MEGEFHNYLNVSSGYLSCAVIPRVAPLMPHISRYYNNHFYICLSQQDIWSESVYPCKPTRKQIRQAIKQFKLELRNGFE